MSAQESNLIFFKIIIIIIVGIEFAERKKVDNIDIARKLQIISLSKNILQRTMQQKN